MANTQQTLYHMISMSFGKRRLDALAFVMARIEYWRVECRNALGTPLYPTYRDLYDSYQKVNQKILYSMEMVDEENIQSSGKQTSAS